MPVTVTFDESFYARPAGCEIGTLTDSFRSRSSSITYDTVSRTLEIAADFVNNSARIYFATSWTLDGVDIDYQSTI